MIDTSQYKEQKPRFLLRLFWIVINATLFRCIVGVRLAFLRNIMLRLFGASVPKHCNIYPNVRIFAPWNLAIGEHSTIGPGCEIYNKGKVSIGNNVTVSQGTYVCTASHDVTSKTMRLKVSEISIHDGVWVASQAFIGPGVTLHKGSVCSARAVVFSDVPEYTIVSGNPAVFLKKRKVKYD
jgi:putative colanic acid biosynthesis acetyltransferase WcaF